MRVTLWKILCCIIWNEAYENLEFFLRGSNCIWNFPLRREVLTETQLLDGVCIFRTKPEEEPRVMLVAFPCVFSVFSLDESWLQLVLQTVWRTQRFPSMTALMVNFWGRLMRLLSPKLHLPPSACHPREWPLGLPALSGSHDSFLSPCTGGWINSRMSHKVPIN